MKLFDALVLTQHVFKDVEEVFPLDPSRNNTESVDISAGAMHAESKGAKGKDLAACFLNGGGRNVALFAGSLDELLDEHIETTEHPGTVLQ